MTSSRHRFLLVPAAALALLVGCDKPTSYETKVTVVQIQRFGRDPKAPGALDLELKFTECPGDVRRLIRLNKTFSQCAGNVKAGDVLPTTVRVGWNAERGSYRSEILELGGCEVDTDPTEEANYEMVQVCHDIEATGMTVGVRCERGRPKELVAKCPWLRRK